MHFVPCRGRSSPAHFHSHARLFCNHLTTSFFRKPTNFASHIPEADGKCCLNLREYYSFFGLGGTANSSRGLLDLASDNFRELLKKSSTSFYKTFQNNERRTTWQWAWRMSPNQIFDRRGRFPSWILWKYHTIKRFTFAIPYHVASHSCCVVSSLGKNKQIQGQLRNKQTRRLNSASLFLSFMMGNVLRVIYTHLLTLICNRNKWR